MHLPGNNAKRLADLIFPTAIKLGCNFPLRPALPILRLGLKIAIGFPIGSEANKYDQAYPKRCECHATSLPSVDPSGQVAVHIDAKEIEQWSGPAHAHGCEKRKTHKAKQGKEKQEPNQAVFQRQDIRLKYLPEIVHSQRSSRQKATKR